MDNGFNPVQEKKENVLLGILGAFLFSLAGAVVWVVLDLIGFIAAISGLVGVFCAIHGYRIFAGKLSKKGIVIAIVIAFIVLAAAWYASIVIAVMRALECPFSFAFKYSIPFLKENGLLGSSIWQLVLGLGFAILGSFGTIRMAFMNVNAEKNARQQMADPAIAAKFGVPEEKIPDIYSDGSSEQTPQQAPDKDEDVRTPGDETKY